MAYVGEEVIIKTLRKVKSSTDGLDWMIIGYSEGSTDKFTVKSFGSGGVEDLARHIDNTMYVYAYLRTTVNGKKSAVLIQFIGEDCTALQKARILLHRDDVTAVLTPYSSIIQCTKTSEIVSKVINQV